MNSNNDEKPRELGYLSYDILKHRKNLPSEERLKQGPVVIIECTEEIPCDPCVEACRFGAINKESLTNPPEVNYEECVGCAECVGACPGLAIFVVHKNYTEERALVYMPYEFSPVPEKGMSAGVLDRSGNKIGEGEIINVKEGKRNTKVLSVAVPKEIVMKVRAVDFRGV